MRKTIIAIAAAATMMVSCTKKNNYMDDASLVFASRIRAQLEPTSQDVTGLTEKKDTVLVFFDKSMVVFLKQEGKDTVYYSSIGIGTDYSPGTTFNVNKDGIEVIAIRSDFVAVIRNNAPSDFYGGQYIKTLTFKEEQ